MAWPQGHSNGNKPTSMPYALNFSRSNLFKVVPDKEDAFQRWAQGLSLGVKLRLEDGEKWFGIWPQGTDEGDWPWPSDQDDEEPFDADDPEMNIACGLARFLREGSVAVITIVGADFSAGHTINVGARAIAVNSKGETVEWDLLDIEEAAKCLGGECTGFEWRGSTEGINE